MPHRKQKADSKSAASKTPDLSNPSKNIYILDTNVLLTCIYVVNDPTDNTEVTYTPNLKNSHIVISWYVLNELNHFKTEQSIRGLRARKVHERIEHALKKRDHSCKITKLTDLKQPVTVKCKGQTLSIVPPLPEAFIKELPWLPTADDSDSWIMLAGLYVGLHIFPNRSPVFVSSDRNARIKAESFALSTCGFNYDNPPYTGFRKLQLPPQLFEQFCYDGKLPLPKGMTEPIANEFFEFSPSDKSCLNKPLLQTVLKANPDTFLTVGRYDKTTKQFVRLLYENSAPSHVPDNVGIAIYHEALINPNIKTIAVSGAAGTGKSFTAIEWAIHSQRIGLYHKECIVVTSKSARLPTGAVVGDIKQKLAPLVGFLYSGVEAYISRLPEFKKWKQSLLRSLPYNDDDGIFDLTGSEELSRSDESSGDDDYYPGGKLPSSAQLIEYAETDPDQLAPAHEYAPRKSKRKKAKHRKQSPQSEAALPPSRKSYGSLLAERVQYYIDKYFKVKAYELLDGETFEDCIVIFDESQKLNTALGERIFSRQGNNCLFICLGDIGQISEQGVNSFNNCFELAKRANFDCPDFALVHLTEQMRSDAADRINKLKQGKITNTTYHTLGYL